MQANMHQALLGSFEPVVVSKDSIPMVTDSSRDYSNDLRLTFTDRHGQSCALGVTLAGRLKYRGDISCPVWWPEDKWKLRVSFEQARNFAQARGVNTENPRAFTAFANELRRKLAVITMLSGPEQTKLSFDSFDVIVQTEDR
jgi:hypothetical protein